MPLLPGSHVLSDHLPELATPRGMLVALAMFIVPAGLAAAALEFLVTDRPTLALVFMIALLIVAHWLLSLAYDPSSQPYATAVFNRGVPALGIHAAAFFFVAVNPTLGETLLFGNSIRLVIAVYLLVVGVGMGVRAVRSGGIDTMAGVYVYFPEEGQLFQDGVYGVLRHPMYGGAARIALGLALIPGSAYALLLAVIIAFVYIPAWLPVEESDLRRRFGDYAAYAEERPALWPSSPAGELELLRRVFLGSSPTTPSASSSSA